MAKIGYARISTTQDQSADLQHDALEAAGCIKVFSDLGVSGSIAKRPGLDEALAYLRPGDTLVCWRLDRMGRRTVAVLQLIEELEARDVAFVSLTEGFDTSTPIGRVLVTLLASFAQLERETMLARTRAGLQAARARGRVGGRPKALTEAQVELARIMFGRDASVTSIAAELGCGRATVYRALAPTEVPA
jgi:DNA invertase Pin-like site-specific DNA recombinase